jgi:O-antigen/teichoic acid export membrane protein
MRSSRVELGLSSTGIYSYANRIPNLVSMVSTIFFQAWNMSAITENESADRGKFYQSVYSAYEAMLFIAAAGLIMICKPITNFLVPDDTFSEYGIVYIYTPILIVAAIFMALNQFLGGIYSATKHTKNSFWTSLTACVANLILNWAMIPVIGIHGAAIATLMSYYLCFWARIIDARYYIPFKFEASRSLLNTGLVVAMSIIVIKAPPMWWLWNVLIFAAVTVYNFKPMLDTVKKILKK